jgi:type IV fimbrial biogenesis protein FimT
MKKVDQGFTLVELIIGLSIMTVLLAYAMPNYYNFKQNKVMTQEINRLVSTINFARNQSITSGHHIILCSSQTMTACDGGSNWHGGWMVFSDINRNRNYDSGDNMLLNENDMNNHIIAQSSQYRKKIRFDRLGATPGTNLTIRFCDDRGKDYGKAVIISNVGRPRVAQQIESCG